MKIVRLTAGLAIGFGGLLAAAHSQTASDGYVAPNLRIAPPRTWHAAAATVSISDLGSTTPVAPANYMVPQSLPTSPPPNVMVSPPIKVPANMPVLLSGGSGDTSSYYAQPAAEQQEPRTLNAIAASKHNLSKQSTTATQDPTKCDQNCPINGGPPAAKDDACPSGSCPTTAGANPATSGSNSTCPCAAGGGNCQCQCQCKCESKCQCDCGNECQCGSQCNYGDKDDEGKCKKCKCRRGCWCELDCPEEKEACKLFDCCCLKRCHLDIGGYTDVGYSYNFYQPTDRWNGVVGFNDRDELQGNQLGVHIEKVTKPDECSCDLGGRIDAIFGTDGRWVQALGLETHDDGTNKWNSERFYHLALPQFYGELASERAKVKVGKFVTPFEYEVIDPTGNFFFSHSYGFLYAGPFTQTGVYATLNLGDNWVVGGGADRGWDRFEDDNDQFGYFATLSWTSCDKSSSLVLVGLTGKEFGLTGINANRTAGSVVMTHKFNPRFTYVAVGDYGIQQQGADGGDADAEWYGIEQYVFYQMCCKWWLGARFEWFRDDDGTRVFPVGDGQTQGVNSNPASVGGFAGNFYEVAVGLNYKPSPNFWIRPEIRYDRFNGVAENGEQPFDDGTRQTQVLAAVDVIVKF